MRRWLDRILRRSQAPDPLAQGSILKGKYRVERTIGRGGMGVVLAAHHELLDQRVAVKVMTDEAARDGESVARFVREARAAAKLQSEHVVRVMDVDTLENGSPFFVMEYLEGRDLSQLVERAGPLPISDVADYGLEALEGIAHAHASGIVHRDLKPSNLFLARRIDGSKCIKILDFGIAKSSASLGKPVTTLTAAGAVGSPCYMSPEQVRSPKLVDARSDVWSMGVTLYELLTAKTPFAGGGWAEMVAAILEREVTPLRARRPDIPPRLEQTVLHCLERDRDRRFANVGELALALAEFGSGAAREKAERVVQVLTGGARRSGAGSDRPVSVHADAQGLAATAPGPSADPMLATNPATASTVRRPKWTLGMRATVRLRVAVAGGTTAGLVAAAVLIALTRRSAPAPASPPLGEPVQLPAESGMPTVASASSPDAGEVKPPAPPQTVSAALASASSVLPARPTPSRRPGSPHAAATSSGVPGGGIPAELKNRQ